MDKQSHPRNTLQAFRSQQATNKYRISSLDYTHGFSSTFLLSTANIPSCRVSACVLCD